VFEFLFFFSLIYLFLNRKKKRKKSLDTELKDLLHSSSDSTGIALDDDKNDREKFSDEQLAEAQRIFDRAGPSSLFWMTEIAAQLTLLATAQKNGIPTNVDYEVKEGATPEEIIDAVVKI
jgi:nucleotide-binding universal stress UspA family protein